MYTHCVHRAVLRHPRLPRPPRPISYLAHPWPNNRFSIMALDALSLLGHFAVWSICALAFQYFCMFLAFLLRQLDRIRWIPDAALVYPLQALSNIAHPWHGTVMAVDAPWLLQSLATSLIASLLFLCLWFRFFSFLIFLLDQVERIYFPETVPTITVPETHPRFARQCRKRIAGFLGRADTINGVDTLDEMITLARKALVLSPQHSEEGRDGCRLLSILLYLRSILKEEDELLIESIELAREAHTFCPPGHAERVLSCGILAEPLARCYQCMGDDRLWKEAVDLRREALALYPVQPWKRWIYGLRGLPSRAALCQGLADSFVTRYERTHHSHYLDEAIDLQLSSLSLCPAGHPDRAASCNNLAKSLWMRYNDSGDDHLLDESINTQREALALCRAQSIDRVLFGQTLANILYTRFMISGDEMILNEVIELQRVGLALYPKGNVFRAEHCLSLATSLRKRRECTGDDQLLHEAIDLQCEAVKFYLESDPGPGLWVSVQDLVGTVFQRFSGTSNDHIRSLFIQLEESARDLYLARNPEWIMTPAARSNMVWRLYRLTGDDSGLDEVINLLRESINLCPLGHRSRAKYCNALIDLQRERYVSTGDDYLLDEIVNLIHQAKAVTHVRAVWRFYCQLSWVHLRQTNTVFFNIGKAILCLAQSLENEPDDTRRLVNDVAACLGDVWTHDVTSLHCELTAVYQRLVNLLPFLAHSALDIEVQLFALWQYRIVGSDAFVSAALAGNSKSGIEMLEVARGVIWAQSLHLRDPQMQGVPEPFKSELEGYLHSIVQPLLSVDPALYDGQDTALTPLDVRHMQSSRAYAAIRNIRALPGFDRFMLGETYETLCAAASAHPVVVLVGARSYFYALIIAPSQFAEHALLSLTLTVEEMREISFIPGLTRTQRGAPAPEDALPKFDRSMKKTKPVRSNDLLYRQLRVLWLKVVRPVFDCLGLKVGACFFKIIN
jgi:hypothetical protein